MFKPKTLLQAILIVPFCAALVFALFTVIEADHPHEGLYGCIDESGKWVVAPQFIGMRPYQDNGLAAAQATNQKWGFIDRSGNWKIDPEYETVGHFSDNGLCYARLEPDGSIGFINESGAWAIDPDSRFGERVGSFFQGLALAEDRQSGKYGYIDETGNWAIEPIYLEATDFNNNKQAKVIFDDPSSGSKVSTLIDIHGQLIPETALATETDQTLTSQSATREEAELLGVTDIQPAWGNDTLYGFVDDVGNWVILPVFSSVAYSIESSEWVFAKDPETNLYGFIDRSGEWRIEPMFLGVLPFYDNPSTWAKDPETKLWGVINTDGTWLKQPFLQSVSESHSQDHEVFFGREDEDSGMGFLDVEGEWISPSRYSSIYDAVAPGGYCATDRETGLWGIASLEEEWMVEPQFLRIRVSDGNLLLCQDPKTKLWGFASWAGEWVIKPSFDYSESRAAQFEGVFIDGYAIVQQSHQPYPHYLFGFGSDLLNATCE